MKKATLTLIATLVVALVLASGNKIIAKRDHDRFVQRRKECLLAMDYKENPYTGWLTKDTTRFWFVESEDGLAIEQYPVHICVYNVDYTDDAVEYVLCTEALDPQEGLSEAEFAEAMDDCVELGNEIRQVYIYVGGKDTPHNKWIGHDRLQFIMDREG